MAHKDLIPIIIDSREIRPYSFDPAKFTAATRALATGDYSLVGYSDEVAFERKSLDDFVQSCTHQRARFIREMERMHSFRFRGVIVEATLGDVECHDYRSRAHPNSILGSACALFTDYDIPVLWWGPRIAARMMLERTLIRCWNILTTPVEKGAEDAARTDYGPSVENTL